MAYRGNLGGVPGGRGPSAYDAWKGVYGGSLEEFFSYLKGDRGDDGKSIKGDKGDKGEKGDDGKSIRGEKGDKGERGEKGDDGKSIKGDKGDKGEKGEKGEKGDDGKSIKGEKGDKGDKGERGIKGEKGDKGDSIKGDKGENGEKGEKGEKGDDGKSIKGEKGDKGDKGENGKDGKSIKGEKGEKGDKGEKGERGDKGENGKDGKPIETQVYKIYSSSNQEITNDFNPIVFNNLEIDTPFVKSLTRNPVDFKINKEGRYRVTINIVTADDMDSNYIKLKMEVNNNKHIFQSNVAVDVFDLRANTTLRFFVAKYLGYEKSTRLQPGQVKIIIEHINNG